MGCRRWSVLCPLLLVLLVFLTSLPAAVLAQGESKKAMSISSTAAQPIEITADRIDYLQETEVYEASGHVVIVQGPLRLTADHVTIMMLPGTLVATGHARLTDPMSEVQAERLELNVNTDAGVITNGTMYMKDSNTSVKGRLIQRFSEDHYRVKEGSFTNCNAKEGQVPAWRFTFKDMDLNAGESFYGKDVWFCINDIPLVPLPSLNFPMQAQRKTGFLMPNAGYDTKFGAHYRQEFFWAMNPSQDLMIIPDYLSERGYGGDLEYRYILSKRSKGQWLFNYIHDNVVKRDRAQLIGTHTQEINPDLSIKAKSYIMTDHTILNDLSNSGVLRASPSQESILNMNQRFTSGNVYVLGQYLQPAGIGGPDTFQRWPEIGHNFVNWAPFDGPVLAGAESTYTYFGREQGFGYSRADIMPSLATDPVSLGHVVAIQPKVNLRGVYYSRGVTTEKVVHRETLWASVDANSRLTRQFALADGAHLLHTIEPDVIYEFVPPTDQSQIIQVDAVDDLSKKNLVTYKIRSRLLEQGAQGSSFNWLDLTVAQSYHPGSVQSLARQFIPPVAPNFGSLTQPLQPAMTAITGKKFSDIWGRVVIGNTTPTIPGVKPVSLTVDTFFDPYRGNFSQWNTDVRYQQADRWYLELGQRYTRDGNRVRRGDIWNPISFNEVFAPTTEVQYATATGAVRLPYGVTVGARTYYDIKNHQRPETDVVGVYQNPCRCWSFSLYYIQFPDRTQFNFLISLTGIGATEGIGTELIKSILHPLLKDEKGLPWPTKPGRSTTTINPAAQGTVTR
jgi:LPS-assembly protein